MKYLVVSFILFFCTLQTFGQQEYFVYLQTDDSQAFYVRLNNSVYSSTTSGYLILSKLPDSTFTITIGFAKNVFPEQLFNISVHSKDAGYLVKNFGDKGWGLFNLQTMAVIMNSNPPAEKKSPEITGSRKNDAFSRLLANVVNDTAILYTVNKPKKIIPAPPAVAIDEKKKKDSLLLVQETLPKKDSADPVNVQPYTIPDSSLAVKNIENPAKDTGTQPANNLPPVKETAIVKSNTLPDDTITAVKKIIAPVSITTAPKNTTATATPSVVKKDNARQSSDTIIIGSSATTKPMVRATVKNKKERKDTIIIMNGRDAELLKPVAKKLLKKETITAENKPLLVIAKNTPINRETVSNALEPKNDTIAIAKNEAIKTATEKKDSVAISAPPKRLRPLVSKAAELFTDTSYVAVFVDESNEQYDTVRISIPFNEKIKEADPTALTATTAITVTKTDTDTITKIVKDLLPVIKHPTAPPTVNSNTTAVNTLAKDSSVAVAPLPVAETIKKVSIIPATTDSAKTVKLPAPPLFLNSDCKEVALDNDIDKLRIKMLIVTTDEDRIALAKKVYKQKCLLAKQVKALSELFKSDAGKYKWLDAVYPFVSDSGNFAALSELIKDDYYLNRFKAMLRRN